MKVLVHTDRWGVEPYGIWWVDGSGNLANVYLDPGSPWALRGQMLLHNRTPEMSWGDYFDWMTSHIPYFDDFAVYDTVFSEDPLMEMHPVDLLHALVPGPSELDLSA
jgi:hypothetical protein